MKKAKIAVVLFLSFGVVLHSYEAMVDATSFSFGWWVWPLIPYSIGVALWLLFRQVYAAVGAMVPPVIMDSFNFYAIFISPQSSTAALGLIFVPIWNFLVFAPLGGFIGWWVGKRLQEDSP